jgi:ATP-dependent DNA helicase RecG
MNRAPIPPELQARLPEFEARLAALQPPAPPQPAPERSEKPARPPHDGRERRARDPEAVPPQAETDAKPEREKRRERNAQRPPRERERREEMRDKGNRPPNSPANQQRPVIGTPPEMAAEGDMMAGALNSPLASTEASAAPQPERRRDPREKDKGGKKERGGRPTVSKPPRAPQHEAVRDGDHDGGDAARHGDDFSSMDSAYEAARGPIRMDIPVVPKLSRPPRRPRVQLPPEQAADILRGLNAPVDKVKGVGPKMAALLNSVGVVSIADLLYYLPRRYDDYTRTSYISKLEAKQKVTVIGTVRHADVRADRNGRRNFAIVVDDGTASMGVTFFGQAYLQKQIRPGQQLRLFGETTVYNGRIQLSNPEWDFLDVEDLQNVRIVPVYPLTEGLTNRSMRSLLERTVDYWADQLPDYVPEAVLERAELADLGWALRNLHFPESDDHLHHARRRYIFDQLLLLQLAIMGNRRAWQLAPAERLDVDEEDVALFAGAVFPYPLTRAQTNAIEDIRRDIAKPIPMNRLLQGDVGAGKTAVAVSAIGMALMRGGQAALMAPTSILAEQHYRGITRLLEKTPLDLMPHGRSPRIVLLTSSVTGAERDAIYAGLADGSIDVVIGTHAVIQSGVDYHHLVLAIIDEQHRFGVEQRKMLRGKGTNPHLLVMTATPIPRTLALTIHADLDLSILDELPPGRIPVGTYIVPTSKRERAYEFIEKELEQGRQAFIVYPLVEVSETVSEARAAVPEFESLKQVFHRHKVGLLHGRMKPAEKDQIMGDFRDHAFDVMVTTSVAEVGVDIPNASVIMIEGANRFGLSQLHQFRGRVGRGGFASHCLLLSDSSDPEATKRLQIVRENADGFRLAEEDFRQRGAGDLIGTQQSGHGSTTLQLTELMSPELVELAQREAKTIYADDPDLSHDEHRLLAARVNMLKDERSDVS